jgi:phosphatidylethanolamine-binding protein (PEBP) family uncharacterized protein
MAQPVASKVTLDSTAFTDGGAIPKRYTCEGQDISPPLAWSGVPTGAGTREGRNDWGRTGYSGPCPPIGRHRYFHKLYALDTDLGDLGRPTKAQLEKAMEGHILAEGRLMGTYEKGQR